MASLPARTSLPVPSPGRQRRWMLGLSASLLASCAMPAWPRTQMGGRWLQVEVQDRDSGERLPVYAADGQWYVAGRPGARYGVTLRNLRRERVLVVMSVDGVNVLTGQTAGTAQTGYVLDPLESAQIDGWRKSDREIAAFEFTALSASYAARTGRPADVGVIGVAVFLERRPEPRRESRPTPRQLPAPTAAPPVFESESRADGSMNKDVAKSSSIARNERSAPAEEKLGTGHGQRETSVVGHTHFVRASSTPDEVIALRYDSRTNLIAQGVIPSPDDRPARPQPFPRSPRTGYVPDPPPY